MRNLSMCDVRLHPSTVGSDFQKAMVQEVLPGAGDVACPTGTLFIRSLYRRAGEDFPLVLLHRDRHIRYDVAKEWHVPACPSR